MNREPRRDILAGIGGTTPATDAHPDAELIAVCREFEKGDTQMANKITAADVREIFATSGFSHAEFCVEQAESQGDASEAREA